MTKLKVENLSVSVGQATLLNQVFLTVEPGELVIILGSNGAGKSTLLRCITGLQTFDQGLVTLDGTLITNLSSIQRARQISYLPQSRPNTWPIRVKDVVALGRYAYGVSPGNLKGEDLTQIEAAIESCNLTHLAERKIDTLSGGEQARVHCARTFCSQAPLVIADEPTNSLDPKHQLEVMNLIMRYVDNGNSGIVVLHEPELAARYADRLVWLKAGQIVADGKPSDTLTPEIMAEVYEVETEIDLAQEFPSVRTIRPR